MNFDWLKPFQAKMHGRTTVVCCSLGLCAFCMWLFLTHSSAFPTASQILLFLAFALAALIIVHTLFAKPRASEPDPRFFFQQVGNQWVMTGGHPSSDELVKVLRDANNINPLPLANAIVQDSVKDGEKSYTPLTSEQAEALQRRDEIAIQEMLQREAESIRRSLLSKQIGGGPVENKSLTPSGDINPNLVLPRQVKEDKF